MSALVKKHMPAGYKRVARLIGYCLFLGENGDDWHVLSMVLRAELSERQLAAMAWAVLRTLPPEMCVAVADAVLPEEAGMPVAPFCDTMEQAVFWADRADPREIEAYCLACFNAMPRGRQAAFLEHVHGRQAA